MKSLHLQGWTTRRIELHWRQPPPVGDGPIREVVVFELEATGQEGRRHRARAEVAPLPGLHRTTLDEAVAATAHWLETHRGRALPQWQEIESEPLLCSLSGPARTAIEGVLIELWASLLQVRPDIVWGRILGTNPADSIRLNALVSGSGDFLVEQVQRALESGYRTIKLKVGRGTLDEDMSRTVTVDAVLASARRDGLPVTLRLDANRAWSLEQASLFVQGLGDRPIEYLEEPLAHAEDLEALHQRTGTPLAVDESAVGSPLTMWRHHPGIVALILKPSVEGGLFPAARRHQEASRLGLGTVWSSTFESAVGRDALGWLALGAGDRRYAHGLATHTWLEEGPIPPRIVPLDGVLTPANDSSRDGEDRT